jgi:HSP20 family protein
MSKASKHNVSNIKPSSQPAAQDTSLSPFTDMQNYFSELEKSMFGSQFLRPGLWPFQDTGMPLFAGRTPRVDVIDRDNEILVKAEIPGVEKKDLDINLSDRNLTIRAQQSKEEKEEKENYYRREISSSRFSRSVMLPVAVDTDKAKASFKDGILEITLPKSEPIQRRNIKIS